MTFEALLKEHHELTERYESSLAEQARLKLVIKKLQHQLFGKSSERRLGDDPRQGLLFETAKDSPKVIEQSVRTHTRRSDR